MLNTCGLWAGLQVWVEWWWRCCWYDNALKAESLGGRPTSPTAGSSGCANPLWDTSKCRRAQTALLRGSTVVGAEKRAATPTTHRTLRRPTTEVVIRQDHVQLNYYAFFRVFWPVLTSVLFFSSFIVESFTRRWSITATVKHHVLSCLFFLLVVPLPSDGLSFFGTQTRAWGASWATCVRVTHLHNMRGEHLWRAECVKFTLHLRPHRGCHLLWTKPLGSYN